MPTKTKKKSAYSISSIDWNKVRKDEQKVSALAAKAKVREDGEGYKVRLSGKEYSTDEDGHILNSRGETDYKASMLLFNAVKKAVRKYEAKRVGLKRSGQHWQFKDSDGRSCCYYQSSLSFKDTVWFGLSGSGHNIHLSETKNSSLRSVLYDIISGTRRSFTGTDYYGSKYSVTAENGGFVLTVLTNMDKKKLTSNNKVSFDARAARMVARIIEGFTDFNDELLGN
jgi:hypothetical protein